MNDKKPTTTPMNSKMKLKKIAEEKNDYDNSKINKERCDIAYYYKKSRVTFL